jgi:hypothetical protein
MADVPKKMGRPQKDINFDQLEGLLVRQWTLKDVSDFFACSEDNIQRRISERYGVTFAELKKEKAAKGKAMVVEKIVKLAIEKDAPWALKMLAVNWLGYKQTAQIDVTNVQIDMSADTKEATSATTIDLIAEYRNISDSG